MLLDWKKEIAEPLLIPDYIEGERATRFDNVGRVHPCAIGTDVTGEGAVECIGEI